MTERIVLFDGVCNLCNASVQFIIKRNPESDIKFGSLQSEAGRELLKSHDLDPNAYYSIILIQNNHVYQRSDAVMQISRRLNFPWPLAYYLGLMFPRFIRDGMYNWVARNRYRFFGKRNECMIPSPELKNRFL